MIYLIIVNIALVLSAILYQLFFKKLTFFQWNRFYLLGTVLISLFIPIGLYIDLSSYYAANEFIPTVDLTDLMDIPVIVSAQSEIKYRLVDVLTCIYWVGVCIAIGYFLIRFARLRRFLSHVDDYRSFSFFNRISIGKRIKEDGVIRLHELVHVSQGHSYDVLFLELVKAFNWFNPIVYFIQKELKFQHECIADEICSEDKVAYANLLVAHALQVPDKVLIHEFSNHSFLKKRIMMLFKNKSSNKKKIMYLSSIPLLGIVALSTLIFNTSNARAIVATVENKIHDKDLPVREIASPRERTNNALVDKTVDGVLIAVQDTAKRVGKIIQKEGKHSRNDKVSNEKKLFTSVEINPEPKNGMAAFRVWISGYYEYPQAAIDEGVRGLVLVSFIVEEDGSLSDIRAIKDIGHGTGEAAVKLMKKSDKWKPGIQDGRKVRVEYTLPIRLDLSAV